MEIGDHDPYRHTYICLLCGHNRGMHKARTLECPGTWKNTFQNQYFLLSNIEKYEEEISKMLIKARIYYAGRC